MLRAASLAAALLILTGCNMLAGLGRDIQRGGEVVSDTAENVKRKF